MKIFNICSNNTISLSSILKKLDSSFGLPNVIMRKKEIANVYKKHGSNSKLKKTIEIKNLIKFENGIKLVINWIEKNSKLFR